MDPTSYADFEIIQLPEIDYSQFELSYSPPPEFRRLPSSVSELSSPSAELSSSELSLSGSMSSEWFPPDKDPRKVQSQAALRLPLGQKPDRFKAACQALRAAGADTDTRQVSTDIVFAPGYEDDLHEFVVLSGGHLSISEPSDAVPEVALAQVTLPLSIWTALLRQPYVRDVYF